MSLHGPIVVVSDTPNSELIFVLGEAGFFPVIESSWAKGATAISHIEPAALILSYRALPPDSKALKKIGRTLESRTGPYMPIIAFTPIDDVPFIEGAIPIAPDAATDHMIARLNSALRIRTLHLTSLRRSAALEEEGASIPLLPEDDPLNDATVLVMGRGRNYPAITTAVGECVSLIGALNMETAAKYLNARDIDGVIIGEGFSNKSVEAILTVLAEDARFRDFPVALIPDMPVGFNSSRMPNLEPVKGDPRTMVKRILPLVRQHAFAARLRRHLAALDTNGSIDPKTGLFTFAAFKNDLEHLVQEAKRHGGTLSLARFSFTNETEDRINLDAARLVSRLVRNIDLACQIDDGSILVTLTGTPLRNGHVVARRIASVLRQTMLLNDDNGNTTRLDPIVTLTGLNAPDTVETLLARVSNVVSVVQ